MSRDELIAKLRAKIIAQRKAREEAQAKALETGTPVPEEWVSIDFLVDHIRGDATCH